MGLQIREFDKLPDDAAQIRREVFMDEQGYQDEFDEVDGRSTHFVAYLNGEPAATCRLFEGRYKGELMLGRLAVRQALRGHHIGARLLEAANAYAKKHGATAITLHAQQDKQRFYELSGYVVSGALDLDEGVPHVWMTRELA